MGRGRAKAKQTKVARDLKYRSYSTDFASLERELRGESNEEIEAELADTYDRYAELADRYSDRDPSDTELEPDDSQQ